MDTSMAATSVRPPARPSDLHALCMQSRQRALHSSLSRSQWLRVGCVMAIASATINLPLADAMPQSSVKLPAILECSSCDTPLATDIPFCGEYVRYSACRTGESWTSMDKAVEAEYTSVANSSTVNASSSEATECLTALKRVTCAKMFNVCEMGSPQSFCLSSCSAALKTNCSAVLDTQATLLQETQTKVCGSKQRLPMGVVDGGKCFDVEYEGPKRTAWIIGFTIAVVFSFLASVGINLQKKALKQNELTAHEQNKEPLPAYRLPLWVLGFVMILLGSILDFVAFGLAPQSLLAPLAALTLVWNMMLAPCFNKEKLSKKDIFATLVIFAGATVAVVFASHTSPSYNLSMLMELYTDPLTCAYFGVVVCCVGLHYSLIRFVEKLSLTSKRHRMIQVGQPLVWSKVRLIGYAGLAGTMGGQSVLFAKSTAELIKAAFHGEDSFAHVQTYLLIFALFSCLLCQVHYLNCGLVHYDALSVVPIYQAYWIISGVLGGAIYFQEIRTFSIEQACMFVLGIVMTIFGVGLLSQRKPVAQPSMKRKLTIDRGTSFSTSDSKLDKPSSFCGLAPVPEVVEPTAQSDDDTHSVDTMPTIQENESEMSTGEESDDDEENPDAVSDDASDDVNRHVIDNYLDMSATMCFTEILDGLGFQNGPQRMLMSRRPSTRNISHDGAGRRPPRRSVDDIEVGMPAASRENMPREKAPKRRSITFSAFQNKKDPNP
ncbi:hypothetical protein Poli38472_010629 [Pythium oligandrum]|uniref:Uncharacterized protein n=1 Tax=Pythium oligandrum TaxID=41045 RepID=A0A8K1C3F5_PYTOL|nr:hypothetical protein Poli38472_010629 [Pythium oligandrum]|eukprot:TMW55747.1 hypothetical protein Poli38472_010629 [Pythium oligandrum]